ncbi:BDN_1c_G0044740.mRNA.1.CDS.1 [Saccharomyces cerevisiae]|nr:BDN_1c_G0044740.mRNA.1.CDS.1 [Saccharomyces cerevisiae]CAI7279346.1 BDN_1c_G0044740.mRNA.1.CDS.1 [Saccharomyces cerevisiae]
MIIINGKATIPFSKISQQRSFRKCSKSTTHKKEKKREHSNRQRNLLYLFLFVVLSNSRIP